MNKTLCSSLWPVTLNLFKQLRFCRNCKKMFELVSWFHPGTQNRHSSQRLMRAVRNEQFGLHVPRVQNLLEMAGQQNEGLSLQIFNRPHQTQMWHCWLETTVNLRLRKKAILNKHLGNTIQEIYFFSPFCFMSRWNFGHKPDFYGFFSTLYFISCSFKELD